MADSLFLLPGLPDSLGDQIVPDTDDCFLAPADVSAYSNHVSVVCFFLAAIPPVAFRRVEGQFTSKLQISGIVDHFVRGFLYHRVKTN